MAAGTGLADSAELRRSFQLTIPFRFGGIVLFPLGSGGRFVLARSIVVDAPLQRLHHAVHETVSDATEQTMPGRWTPHVTLSRRLSADQVGTALGTLGDGGGDIPGGTFSAARLWDSEQKVITELAT